MLDSYPFFDRDDHPSEALLAVLKLYELKHDGTMEGIFHVTQREWMQRDAAYRALIVNRHGK